MENTPENKTTPVVINERVLTVSEHLIEKFQISKAEAIGLASVLIANGHVSGGLLKDFKVGFA